MFPLLFVGGIFRPRLAATVAGTVLVGREFYRIGYLTKEGPSSVIREIGAVPTNVSEILLILGIGSIYLRRKFGPFFANRRFVQRWTMSKYDRAYEKVLDEINNPRSQSYYLVRRNRSKLPMDPRILQQEFDIRAAEGRPIPGELSPAERKRRANSANLPDIKYYM